MLSYYNIIGNIAIFSTTMAFTIKSMARTRKIIRYFLS